MVNMMFPLTCLVDMHIFISGLCVCVCVYTRFICANLRLKFDLLFKETLAKSKAAISFAGTSHSSALLVACVIII